MLFHAVARRRIPLVLRIVSHTLLLVVLALLIHAWIMGLQFKHAMQEHADALGQSLLTQTAASATELLVANDILSLSVLLNNLVENPLVAYAAIHSVDNRVLAEAGSQPPRSLLDDDQGLYSAPIAFQEVIAGRLSLRLDMQRFQQPMTISLQNMGLLSLILLALTLVLSLRLGRRISTPLMQLRLWLRDPDFPAPGATRQDEIGDLARQLQARLVQDSEARQAAPARGPREREDDDLHELDGLDDLLPEDDEPAPPRVSVPRAAPPAPPPAAPAAPLPTASDAPWDTLDDLEPDPVPLHEPDPRSAVLAVQLAHGREHGRERQERLRRCLEQVAGLYRGSLLHLKDGASLLLFHSRGNEQNYLTHALCCGELLRAWSDAQRGDEPEADLALQLGLAEGEALSARAPAELLLSEPVQAALALCEQSRNLLLLERRLGNDELLRQRACIRPVARPENASCLERLLAPYTSLLVRQLAQLDVGRNAT